MRRTRESVECATAHSKENRMRRTRKSRMRYSLYVIGEYWNVLQSVPERIEYAALERGEHATACVERTECAASYAQVGKRVASPAQERIVCPSRERRGCLASCAREKLE